MTTNEELFGQFMNINQQMKMLRHKAERERGPLGNETHGQGRVLALLKLHDGVSTRQMAEILGIRVSSLNEVLTKMEEQNLITRTPSEDDRRVMLIELTDEGRAIEMPGHRMPALMFECFTDEEKEVLSGHLDRIAESLGKDLDEEDYERFENMRKCHAEFMKKSKCHGHGEGRGHGHGNHHGGGCGHGHRSHEHGHAGGGRAHGRGRHCHDERAHHAFGGGHEEKAFCDGYCCTCSVCIR